MARVKKRVAKGACWRYTAGRKPYCARVVERRFGGPVHLEAWDSTKGANGGYQRRSLAFRVRDERGRLVPEAEEKAREVADELSTRRRRGEVDLHRDRKRTLREIFDLYLRHRTPQKSEREQTNDLRLVEMWKRVLGAEMRPEDDILLADWETFIAARSSGSIDARGRPVLPNRRNTVRPTTVRGDCDWLGFVFGWATRWKLPDRTYLMREDPIRGFERPKVVNIRREVASDDRIEAIREVAHLVTMRIGWGGQRTTVPSHLSELFDLAVVTGRRLGAIRQLRYSDLRLNEGPYGSIVWPADTDKGGREWSGPLSPRAREAIDRILQKRPMVGNAPLFPSPGDPSKPVSRHLPDKWLREAEKLAGLEPQDGSLWHAYRRRWATVRKSLPVQDVARAGGWRSVSVVQSIYAQADEETTLEVVMFDGELREARRE